MVKYGSSAVTSQSSTLRFKDWDLLTTPVIHPEERHDT